jgi:hypothetical protein
MKRSILILLSINFSICYSQDSAVQKQNQITYKPFLGWRMNGHGLSNKQFKEEIYKVPAAVLLYQKGKRNQTIGFACLIPMGLFMILGRQETNIVSPQFGKNKIGFTIAGIVSGGAVIYFISHSGKQLRRAAKIHNDAQPLIY